jgi:hypothetical protein
VTEGQRIVAFYEGTATDDRGRSLDDILSFDDARLEAVHDFIQWLFPLPERSGANPPAPTLDQAAIDAFAGRSKLRAALRRSLDRMLAFYGFACSGDRIVKSKTFAVQSTNWLHAGNHNHLRLTRIVRSLTVLGEARLARSFLEVLSDIYENERRSGGDRISQRSFQFWCSAVED